MNEISKELKQCTIDSLIKIFPDIDPMQWHIDIIRPDNIIQCERYGINNVYFNFLDNGKYEVEIFTPIESEILSYKFDEASIAKMFYISHCDHLQAIRKVISEAI